MNKFDDEVNKNNKESLQYRKLMIDNLLHYEMGEQAAWRGESIDRMPAFKKQNRISAWLKGHSDARHKKQLQADYGQVNKAGLIKLKDIIAAAVKAHS